MEQFLKGQPALVTGASKGIGFAIAEALLQAGAEVAICGRDEKSLSEAAERLKPLGKVVHTRADMTREEDVQALLDFVKQQLGGLRILINNAGLGVFKPVADLQPAEWRLTLDTNLTGVYYCTHYALPLLRAQGGSVIQISSLAGKNPFAGGAAYNASKFGLNGFSEALMLDHRNDKIRVTSIMPGSVNTDFSTRSEKADWKIQPEDIAQIVLDVLRLPERTLVSHVEVRPSRPK